MKFPLIETFSVAINKAKAKILSLTAKKQLTKEEIAEQKRLKISHTIYPDDWVDRSTDIQK